MGNSNENIINQKNVSYMYVFDSKYPEVCWIMCTEYLELNNPILKSSTEEIITQKVVKFCVMHNERMGFV